MSDYILWVCAYLPLIQSAVEKAAAVVTDADKTPVNEKREQMHDPAAGDGHAAAYLRQSQATRRNRESGGV